MSGTQRSLQHVVSLSSRVQCVEWMEIDESVNGDAGLFGRAVAQFPSLFRSDKRRVNLNKARDWWKKQDATRAKLDDKKQLKYASSVKGSRQQFVVKALSGRGRKLESQWEWLYPKLLGEFERLRRAGVKFSARLVMDMATVMIEDSDDPVFNKAFMIRGVPFREKVTERRVQDFLDRFNIVYRRLKGNKQVSDEKQLQIDISIAAHLDRIKRQFDDKTVDPDQIYNMDESHFVIDLDDGKTLDFQGSEEVKYHKIVSGREGITMCVLLKGGSDAKVLCPMLIFKNVNSSHPIQGLPDAVNGVCYRSTPSAFINNATMLEWLQDVRCWGPGGLFAGERVLWLDNASGHSSQGAQDTAKQLRTRIKFFPPNATDRVQPADRFPIQRIKTHWRALCEARNMKAIREGDWATKSGALANPGKQFFLETAAECIRRVNLEMDANKVNWAKKSMLQCGLDVPEDGVWKVSQLSRKLREIVDTHSTVFEAAYKESDTLAEDLPALL